MKATKKQSQWALILTLILSAAAWYIKQNYRTPDNNKTERSEVANKYDKINLENQASKPNKKQQTVKKGTSIPANILSKLTPVTLKSNKFDVLKNCTIKKHRNNDGDSFHVKYGNKETEFRLYFADTPESRLHKYNGKRIKEQSQYFGLDMQVTTEVGKIAKSFVTDLLSTKPFTVVTKWEEVYTPDRKYCYVIVDYNGKPTYLHELLTAKGLIRFKTRGAPLPDDKTSYHQQKRKLQDIEKAAKKAKLGAWGM